MESEMKKMLIIAAILAIASPAFAQSYDPEVGSGNLAGASSAQPSTYLGGEGAYARVVPGGTRHRAAAVVRSVPNVVYDQSGHAVGTDPDPNIRLQLQREGDSIEGF
jgi:hypothetical protein